jgi:hypothetical protein
MHSFPGKTEYLHGCPDFRDCSIYVSCCALDINARMVCPLAAFKHNFIYVKVTSRQLHVKIGIPALSLVAQEHQHVACHCVEHVRMMCCWACYSPHLAYEHPLVLP